MPSHEEWSRRLAQIFATHYVRVIRSVQAGKVIETGERIAEVIDQPRAGQLVDRALFQARRVVARLDKLATDAHAATMLRKDASGNSITVIGWMKDAWRKFARQIGTIANMQTQEVAEEAQEALSQALPEFLTTGQLVKEWVTVGDERVRGNPNGRYKNSPFDHWSADGQRADQNGGVFTVSGEQLRFPGDTGLGASLGNTINCRCSIRRIWIKPDGTEQVIDNQVLNPSYPTRASRRPGENVNKPRPGLKPSTAFTFGVGKGPWRGVVFLRNGQRANYTVRNGGVTIRVGGKPVASAPISRDNFGKWTLGRVTTTQGYENVGLDDMLRASVEASNALPK